VASTPGISQVALSTNGYRLAELAAPLRTAGVAQVNVSIDSLDRARFAKITGQDILPEILSGIEVALAVGLRVKVNVVRLRGLNDDMLDQALVWVRDRPVIVRFIQLMRTGDNAEVFSQHHMPYDDGRDALLQRGFLPRSRAADAGPAEELFHPDYAGGIGFIAPYRPGFCDTCNRLRVTSTGQLQMCLFGDGAIDLRPLIGDDQALIARVRAALPDKPEAHRLAVGRVGRTRHLAMVGG
jgi:cyclic pyranopterin phosphate synthase